MIHAQQEIGSCGTNDGLIGEPRLIQKSLHPFCNFLADHIKNNCLETYINVNVHFFVADDCSGKTGARNQQDRLEQKEVFERADNFIKAANEYLEEISENKEQIEISKFYERLPNPTLIAIDEFLNDEIYYRYKDKNRKFQ